MVIVKPFVINCQWIEGPPIFKGLKYYTKISLGILCPNEKIIVLARQFLYLRINRDKFSITKGRGILKKPTSGLKKKGVI